MALTQIQIIQSLGEAMNWMERELSWGVPATEQRHLVGRIGELYAALITNGQMAPEVNQRGYDVVSKDGERISVKTTAQQGTSGHLTINENTLGEVDRVMVFFLNTEEMQIETLLDGSVSEMKEICGNANSQGRLTLSLGKLRSGGGKVIRSVEDQSITRQIDHEGYTIIELESGTICVKKGGSYIEPVKPVLRSIAGELGVSILNSNGNTYTTRQLGTHVLNELLSK